MIEELKREGNWIVLERGGSKVGRMYADSESARRAMRRLEKSSAARDRFFSRRSK